MVPTAPSTPHLSPASDSDSALPSSSVPASSSSSSSSPPSALAPTPSSALAALCAVASVHQVACDPAVLAHQLGLSPSSPISIGDVLRAAKLLGLKARRVRTTTQRLAHTPLPALAVCRATDGSDRLRLVTIARADAQRVLLQEELRRHRPDRNMYKKHHWQVVGPTFNQLHLMYDQHFLAQVELVDIIAERIQLLGGVAIAMAADVAETTRIARPPRGREPASVQLSRLADAHEQIIIEARKNAEEVGEDSGTNDVLVSNVLRVNELQVWFLTEHLVAASPV